MAVLNETHAASKADEPPMRDRDGNLARIRVSEPIGLHLLASDGNTDTPPAPQTLIAKLSEPEAAEMIERHVEFVAETKVGDRPVHLASPFVKHFLKRDDHALPTVTGVATLPIVLGNGDLLSGEGLDRRSGIVFRVPSGLWVPARKECGDTAVKRGHKVPAHRMACRCRDR